MLTKNDFKRILIVRLSSIGDVVMTTPVAKALRGAFPEAYLAWIVEDKSRDILEGNPYLDEVIVWNRSSIAPGPVGYLKSMLGLRRELKKRRFDVAIDFQGLCRSAVVAKLSGARRCLGYSNVREKAGVLYDVRLQMDNGRLRGRELYAKMLGLLGVPTDDLEMHIPIGDKDRAFAREIIADGIAARKGARGVAALCPATTWPHKHWTEDGWARLADGLLSRYGVMPIFLGSKADSALVERIRGLMDGESASAVGGTSLRQAAAIIEQSDLVAAVDTGLLHIAVALNRPTVAIFGPTAWDYLSDVETLAVVAKSLPCMPCFRHPTCEAYECMRSVTDDDVLSAAEKWLVGKHANARS